MGCHIERETNIPRPIVYVVITPEKIAELWKGICSRNNPENYLSAFIFPPLRVDVAGTDKLTYFQIVDNNMLYLIECVIDINPIKKGNYYLANVFYVKQKLNDVVNRLEEGKIKVINF